MISGHVIDDVTAIKSFWNSLLYSLLRSHYLCRHATRPLPTNGSSNRTASLSRFWPVTVTVPSAELFRAKFSVGRLNRPIIAGVLSVTHVVPTPRHNNIITCHVCPLLLLNHVHEEIYIVAYFLKVEILITKKVATHVVL